MRLLFIPDPDIMSVDSSLGLTDVGVHVDGVDGLLNLPASFFIIKSPLFSAAFSLSLLPAWEIRTELQCFFSKWFDNCFA